MNDSADISLGSGEIYLTENGDDAFFLQSGSLLIYAVSEDNGKYGRRTFIYEARAGEVIPGFFYTDMRYRRHRFLFSSGESVSLKVIRNGATKNCKPVF